MEFLWFVINCVKSELNPSQNLEYLGMIINSNLLSLALPEGKVDAILKLCLDSLWSGKSGWVSFRDLTKIVGNYSCVLPTVPFVEGHLRKLQSFYISPFHEDMDRSVCLTPEARADLLWWATHLKSVILFSWCTRSLYFFWCLSPWLECCLWWIPLSRSMAITRQISSHQRARIDERFVRASEFYSFIR